MADKVGITNLTIEQTKVIIDALDLYNRITLGQFEEIHSYLLRKKIPLGPNSTDQITNLNTILSLIKNIKVLCDYPANGSYGIGNRILPKSNSISYELLKTFQLAVAEHEEPNPKFKNVLYDGLPVRYTSDSLPEIKVYEDI